VGIRNLFGGRSTRVEGTFTVTGTAVSVDSDGDRNVRFSGVLTGPGVPATAVQATRRFWAGQPVPAQGDALPAQIDPERPQRFSVTWPPRYSASTQALADRAHAEQVAAALRLGLDPSVVPAAPPVAPDVKSMVRAEMEHRYANHLLPDGNRPVSREEADRFCVDGAAAVATITGIDFLTVPAKALPSADAGIANVAVRVRLTDGTEYATTARFGYRNAHRREQFGRIGAEVPVRLDPADRARVCMDTTALPPLHG
jgi:hypothetical protein